MVTLNMPILLVLIFQLFVFLAQGSEGFAGILVITPLTSISKNQISAESVQRDYLSVI